MEYIKTLLLYNCPFSRSSTTLLSAVLTVDRATSSAAEACDVPGIIKNGGILTFLDIESILSSKSFIILVVTIPNSLRNFSQLSFSTANSDFSPIGKNKNQLFLDGIHWLYL